MHFHFAAAMCLMLVFTAVTATDVSGATYYVRGTTGSDSNTGLSASTAFQTIKKAAEIIKSGDTVRVGAGTYTDDIVVDGVQQSTQPATFIVDYGDVIVANAEWKVLNSNYVEITGFKFQGATSRFLLWIDSYEGLLHNCEFIAADEGLLVTNGSLTIDNCQIQDFTRDGIQVDGGARLTVSNSTISGCQEAGVEIRKMARVVFDNCNLTGQAGDAIEVNVVADVFYDGTLGPPPLVGSNGPITFSSGTYVHGNFFHSAGGTLTQYQLDRISGSAFEFLSGPLLPIDPGDAASINNNANIPLTDSGKQAVIKGGTELSITNNDGLDLPPGVYYFEDVRCLSTMRLSGPVTIYVTGAAILDNIVSSSSDPADFRLYVMGDAITLKSTSTTYGVVYGPSAQITVGTSSHLHGMLVGAGVDFKNGAQLYPDDSVAGLARSLVGVSTTQPAPPPSWTPVTSGELDISHSTLSNNDNAVRMVTAQALTATSSDFSNNGWGLRMRGTVDLLNCTIIDNTTGGVWLTDSTDADVQILNLKLTNNAVYGVYTESCQLTFDSSKIDNWAISGSQHSIAGVGSDLVFNSVTIPSGTIAGVYLWQGNLTATDTTFSGSGYGLAVDDSDVTLTSCTVSGNSVGLYANQNPTLAVNNTTITGNSQQGAAVYGEGTGGTAIFDKCTIHTNGVGLYASQNNSLTVRNSTVRDNTSWGIGIDASSGSGATATLDTCSIYGNAGGVSIYGASDGYLTLADTVVRDNTQEGLHFESCNLTLTDQASANWSVLRNHIGIVSNTSTLTLTNVAITDSSYIGVKCEDSDVTLAGCTVSGPNGIMADAANNSLSIDASRFDSTSSTGWGMVRYGGAVDVKNSIFNGYLGGVFLSTAGAEAAVVHNTTVANSKDYGIYVPQGDATVQNTIIAGNDANYVGLYVGTGELTHSHNLVHGFATPFSGTNADSTEVQKSPRFFDAASADLRLAVGSPAINAGMDLLSVPTDMEGNARPSHKAYDIGAYEYMSNYGSLRVLSWREIE